MLLIAAVRVADKCVCLMLLRVFREMPLFHFISISLFSGKWCCAILLMTLKANFRCLVMKKWQSTVYPTVKHVLKNPKLIADNFVDCVIV